MFLFFFVGGKPEKINLSDLKPETEAAAVTALGPGIAIIFTSSPNNSVTFSINIFPGSEIPGVPASETKAKFFPCFNKIKISSIFFIFECW